MSDFEFTSVVVSILIAFAFSEVLSTWGRIIKRRRQIKFSGLYLGTSVLLLLALLGHWLGMSGYRALPAISPAESLKLGIIDDALLNAGSANLCRRNAASRASATLFRLGPTAPPFSPTTWQPTQAFSVINASPAEMTAGSVDTSFENVTGISICPGATLASPLVA